jgi:hypothetical protein
MSVVDLDENGNLIQQFLTEGPFSIGGNAFTATPQLYTVKVNVDYVFKAGHSIGFGIGLGSSIEGYTASVYFGSADKPSGAILPIVDTAESYDFNADYQKIHISSDSAVDNYEYDSSKKTIQFTARLFDYTSGYCNLTIPKSLMRTPFTITADAQQITPTLTETQSNYQIYFTHTRSSNPIKVTGTALPTPTITATPIELPVPTESIVPTGSPVPTELPTPTSSTAPTGSSSPNESIAPIISSAPKSTTSQPNNSSQGTTSVTANPANEPSPSVRILGLSLIATAIIIAGTTVFLVVYKKWTLANHPASL